MSDLILAAPGWRVCIWSREQGGVIALDVVAWEREPYTLRGNTQYPERTRLRPYVLSEFGEDVAPLPEEAWFVGVMPPGSDLHDYAEAGEQVAKAEEAEEDREYERRKSEAATAANSQEPSDA